MKSAAQYLLVAALMGVSGVVGFSLPRHAVEKVEEISVVQGQEEALPSKLPAREVTPYLVRELMNPTKHEQQQLRAVRELPSNLSSKEFAALIDVLRKPAPETISLNRWHTLLNEIMETLRKPRFERSGYASAMQDLMLDRGLDPIVRDYAAQHLVQYLTNVGEKVNEDVLEEGITTLISVLESERDAFEPVSGTALISLCDLHARGEGMGFASHREKLEKLVTEYVEGSRPGMLPLQISAVQAAGRLKVEQALPAIRSYATGEVPNPSLRLGSIAALGYFTDAEDRPFLEEMAASDTRFRFAASAALKNFTR